jgi:hypothetical protein
LLVSDSLNFLIESYNQLVLEMRLMRGKPID